MNRNLPTATGERSSARSYSRQALAFAGLLVVAGCSAAAPAAPPQPRVAVAADPPMRFYESFCAAENPGSWQPGPFGDNVEVLAHKLAVPLSTVAQDSKSGLAVCDDPLETERILTGGDAIPQIIVSGLGNRCLATGVPAWREAGGLTYRVYTTCVTGS